MMLKSWKYFLPMLVFLVFISSGVHAATVNCTFMSETTLSTSGEWLKTETDIMKLITMFGDGFSLPLENSLLGVNGDAMTIYDGSCQISFG